MSPVSGSSFVPHASTASEIGDPGLSSSSANHSLLKIGFYQGQVQLAGASIEPGSPVAAVGRPTGENRTPPGMAAYQACGDHAIDPLYQAMGPAPGSHRQIWAPATRSPAPSVVLEQHADHDGQALAFLRNARRDGHPPPSTSCGASLPSSVGGVRGPGPAGAERSRGPCSAGGAAAHERGPLLPRARRLPRAQKEWHAPTRP